jgi:hypothetical protein
MSLGNTLPLGASCQLLLQGTGGFSLYGAAQTCGGGKPSTVGYAYSGSHAPAWEPIPVLGSATVCIPTQERGNEAVLSNGLPLDMASQWLIRETGGFPLHGAVPAYGGEKPSTVGYALRTFYSFAGFIQ